MKVKDKLYSLTDWGECWSMPRFSVRTYTITKINKKIIEMWGYSWKIKMSEIGWKYFTSKKAMYEYYLKEFKEELEEVSFPYIEGIKSMERRLRSIK